MNTPQENPAPMGRATALGILARIAYRPDLTVEEVTALQMAARAVAKRHFEHERNWKRRHAALSAGAGAPPEEAPVFPVPSVPAVPAVAEA